MSAGQSPMEIGEISFGLMDPEEYRDMSATKVITADTYDDDGFPIDMGLMDPVWASSTPGWSARRAASARVRVTATSATSNSRRRSSTWAFEAHPPATPRDVPGVLAAPAHRGGERRVPRRPRPHAEPPPGRLRRHDGGHPGGPEEGPLPALRRGPVRRQAREADDVLRSPAGSRVGLLRAHRGVDAAGPRRRRGPRHQPAGARRADRHRDQPHQRDPLGRVPTATRRPRGHRGRARRRPHLPRT